MNQTELKAYAEAKALEKYPHVKVNVSNPHYLDAIEANGFSASKREIYTQAIIDTYEEKQSDAVEFTEWLLLSGYEAYDYRWKKKWDYISHSYTSEQIYELFKQSKTK